MDIMLYIVVLGLVIVVCALIYELSKAKADIADLEYEVTNQKLEYRREIKALKEEKTLYNNYKTLLGEGKFSEKDFNTWIAKCVEDIKTCDTCGFRPWCDEKRECSTKNTSETQ